MQTKLSHTCKNQESRTQKETHINQTNLNIKKIKILTIQAKYQLKIESLWVFIQNRKRKKKSRNGHAKKQKIIGS